MINKIQCREVYILEKCFVHRNKTQRTALWHSFNGNFQETVLTFGSHNLFVTYISPGGYKFIVSYNVWGMTLICRRTAFNVNTPELLTISREFSKTPAKLPDSFPQNCVFIKWVNVVFTFRAIQEAPGARGFDSRPPSLLILCSLCCLCL